MKKKSKSIANYYPYLPYISLFLIIAVWELVGVVFHIPVWIFPKPTTIFNSFIQSRDLIFYHSIQTSIEAGVGLIISIICGVLLAILMEWSFIMRKLIYPILLLSQTIPFITLAPLLVIWFGYGFLSKIIIVALVCFFPITINLYDGFQTIDFHMIKLMRAMNATTKQIFYLVKLPAVLPHLFSGVRISATYAVLTAVISEWIGSDRGLGILLVRSSKSFLTDRVFAVVGVITLLSLTLVALVEIVAKTAIPWHYQSLKRRQ